jgi:hypothetical protein
MPELVLARIIAASSNAGDVVLDPFSGSGTTAVVACQLGRKYSGIDISENYVAKSMERIEELKKARKPSKKGFGVLEAREELELRRLYADVGIEAKEILASKKLSGIFVEQFRVRMNTDKCYDEHNIAMALMDMSY